MYFNPRSPCGERLAISAHKQDTLLFQPTLPMRGATKHSLKQQQARYISTHAPHAGSDGSPFVAYFLRLNFNPRSPCGERQSFVKKNGFIFVISTHAPHAGSDALLMPLVQRELYFNPRSPCGERRGVPYNNNCKEVFQPTLPMRGATATYSSQLNSSTSLLPNHHSDIDSIDKIIHNRH